MQQAEISFSLSKVHVGGHYFITSAVKILSTRGTKFHGNGHYLILQFCEKLSRQTLFWLIPISGGDATQ